MEAAVDAHFVDQARPLFRPGSAKWIGLRRWAWYLDLFFCIAVGDSASLAMTPAQYIDCWDAEPRLMAVLAVIQKRVRFNLSEKMRRSKNAGTRHVRNSPAAQR